MAKLKGHARNFKGWDEQTAKGTSHLHLSAAPTNRSSLTSRALQMSIPKSSTPIPTKTKSPVRRAKLNRRALNTMLMLGMHSLSIPVNAIIHPNDYKSKSKLRRKEPVSLGPQYRGSRVSRDALDQQDDSGDDAAEDSDGSEQYDDPLTANLEADQKLDDDAEIDSDDALGESDEEKFKDFTFRGSSYPASKKARGSKRPTAADWMGSDEAPDEDEEDEDDEEDDEEDEEMEYPNHDMVDEEAEETSDDEGDEDEDSMDGFIDDGDDDEEGESEDQDDEAGEDEETDEDQDEAPKPGKSNNRNSLRDILQSGQKTVANNLSSARQTDVSKGKAVRQQQKTFDALLHIRIRMQKSLVAVNSLSIVEGDEEQSEPYEAAEAAALKLWNTIDSFRYDRQPDDAKAGKKRKRVADTDTSSQKMWEQMEALELPATTRRRAVLENWSQRSKSTRTDNKAAKKFQRSAEKSLTTRLDDELEAPERLIKRTRTPRSCAPGQVSRKVSEDAGIYDDADFYQLLLKELVDQRTGDTTSGSGTAATIRYTAAKEAKAKRHVDTKASKGRKMRFNVHEKLQNFTAPEDRRSWEQSAIDRLFGTLFGQKLMLDENVDEQDRASDEDEDEQMGGVEAGDGAALRLFR